MDAPPLPETTLELLPVTEAARRYPIGVKRLYRLIREGEIPAVPLTGLKRTRYLVRPAVIEAWLLAQETATHRP